MGVERIAVYTAVYGGVDEPPEPVPQDVAVDFICFTDDRDLRAAGWRVVEAPPRYEDPVLAAKVPKMLPGEHLPEHRWALWVDGNIAIDNPGFAREAIGVARRSGNPMVVWRHPVRSSIYEEIDECVSLPKCSGLPLRAQGDAYRAEGHPEDAGLFGCGSIVWDTSSTAAAEVGAQWLAECERWTTRDQISLPVVLERLGHRPALFPHHLFRHRPLGALSCWLRRRSWGRRALRWAAGRSSVRGAYATLDARSSVAPIPRAWWTIGNPWFEIRPHRTPA